MNTKELKEAFITLYGKPADALYFAPGRVNLIGEHTDYNGGFVFPCALSFGTYLLCRKNDDNVIRFRSLNQPEVVETTLDQLQTPQGKSWVNGHNLGRYWSVGPQQTLYLPAEWLHKGANRIEVLELNKPEQIQLRDINHPILNTLQ